MYIQRVRRWVPILVIGLILSTVYAANPMPALAAAPADGLYARAYSEDANKAIIQRLYDEALNGRNVDLLDELYASDYTEHSEALLGGVEVLKTTFLSNFNQFPDAIWEIKRMAADDDLVWVHAQINPTGEQGNEWVGLAIIEIYRLKDGRIVEHWESQQYIPEETVSGHTMFEELTPAVTEPVSEEEMERNKEVIRKLWAEFFNPPHNFDILPAIYGANHKEHNPGEPDGVDGLIEIFTGLFEQEPNFGAEILLLSADGPYVWLYNQPMIIGAEENPLAAGKGADIYKMADGKIIEHWDVILYPSPPAAEATETQQAAPQMPEPTMTQLDEGVYHYFGGFYSSLVVVTNEGVLITDPSNAARGEMLKQAIAELTDQPVTHIALTHEHYDHTGGTEIFPAAQVICHVACADIFQLDEYGLVPDEVDITFKTYLSIELGDKTVELHHLGPGDGVATTIIYLPKEQVVMSADLYEPRALTNALFMDDKNPLGVRKILNEVASWNLKHAINGHSPGTDPQDLREAAGYYEDLYQAVNAVLQPIIEQSGVTAAYGASFSLHEQISLPQYAEWGEYDTAFAKHVFRMAMGLMHGG